MQHLIKRLLCAYSEPAYAGEKRACAQGPLQAQPCSGPSNNNRSNCSGASAIGAGTGSTPTGSPSPNPIPHNPHSTSSSASQNAPSPPQPPQTATSPTASNPAPPPSSRVQPPGAPKMETASPSAAASQAPAPLACLSGYSARVVGSLLAKMCGDVLGAGVEGWLSQQVRRSYPEGLTDFPCTNRGFGRYTDDTQMAIALTRSLLACGGRCDDVDAARCYAAEFQPFRGYGDSAFKLLASLQREGVNAESIKTIGTKYIPGGSFGNGGAMRIAPLALVYRHAPPAVLRAAVAAALRCTHVHPIAIDGAFVIALAVSYLATRQPGPMKPSAASCPAGPMAPTAAAAVVDAAEDPGGGGDGAVALSGGAAAASDGGSGDVAGAPAAAAAAAVATPLGLLDHLLLQRGLLETEDMVAKLMAVRAAFTLAPAFKQQHEPWSEYFGSPGWPAELGLQAEVSDLFQIRADEAAAAALSALCWHWDCPEDAIVAAVHYGGDTDTVAAITGALAGALHGVSWLPSRWWDALENGPAGRDEVVGLAVKLAKLENCD